MPKSPKQLKNLERLKGALDKRLPGVPQAVHKVTKKVVTKAAQKVAFQAPPQTLNLNPEQIRILEHEKKILKEALFREERKLSWDSFWYFLTNILFPNTWEEHYSLEFHKPLVEKLQNLEQGKDIWFIIPREHRKSFILTIAHTLWLIIKDPNVRIILVGAREETVKPFSRLIRSAFIEGTPGFEKFQEVFDDFVYKEGEGGKILRQAFQFECKLKTRTTPDPTFRAAYLGVTGAGWRCDWLKYDDAIERRNVSNPEMSMKTLGQVLDLIPLVDTKSKYRNIGGAGTRWAYHDPYGKIIGESVEEDDKFQETLDRLKRRGTQVIVRHSLEDPDTPCQHCPKHITDLFPHGNPDMEKGKAICYPVHTRKSILSQYERYLIDPNLGESMFWHQYMNVCMSPANRKFQQEWFYQLHQPVWPVFKRRILAIDGAEKDFQSAGLGDYMVALFGEFDDTGRLCLVHGLRSNRWTKEEFQSTIIAWCLATKWWPSYVVKEKFGTDSFLSDMQRAFLKQSKPVFCHAETRASMREANNVKKFDWIVACLQGPMERAEVVFGSSFPRAILERAKYELTNLGQVAHDDVADTLALFMVPKVRVKFVDQGPDRHFGWKPVSLNLYDPEHKGVLSPWEMEDLKMGIVKIDAEDLALTQAKETKKVHQAFVEFGDGVGWQGMPESERVQFTLGDYE